MKESSGGDNLGEDNTMEILFEYLKKDVPVELAIYTRKYVTEASRKMIPFNDWAVKVLKGHIRAIGCLYHVKDNDKGSGLERDKTNRKQALKDKSKIPISLKAKMSRNGQNKGKKDEEKFG